MEASALLEGLRLADEQGILSLVVESDFREIVQAILDPSEYRAAAAVLTDDCRKVLKSFGRATIDHCARNATHRLDGDSFRVKSGWKGPTRPWPWTWLSWPQANLRGRGTTHFLNAHGLAGLMVSRIGLIVVI
ncbi:hypothetical protein ZWY2020_043817 [Hordeum vulgare]|nr:hypothetical protein ZWY2020_043817 [Hordeum vulgare]